MNSSAPILFSTGMTVVTLRDVVGDTDRVLHPEGSVGIVVSHANSQSQQYRIRFLDGYEEEFGSFELTTLAKFKEGSIEQSVNLDRGVHFQRVILQCVIGSQAYGLADAESDIDRRGVYLPKATDHWSLWGVPEQLECHETQESYWELQKFIVLALKANPNVLECLYSPIVEKATTLGKELLDIRNGFLSRLVYQTFNGYVTSQFKKMQASIRNHGQVKWKHVMHLIRLLIVGGNILRKGSLEVEVAAEHRDRLLAIKRGEMPWEESESWRKLLHEEFNAALKSTNLPERPDYETANQFLLKARLAAIEEELP